METGFRGTFVISWTQTELDGLAAAPAEALAVGSTWRWSGEAVRVDGPTAVLVLGQAEETERLRHSAALGVRRLVGQALNRAPPGRVPEPEEPILNHGLAVTDGISSFTATLIDVPDRTWPLLMFLDRVPPPGQDLWITRVTNEMSRPNRQGAVAPAVICFTPGTCIATPTGTHQVRDLVEGDLVLTKDDGPQPVRWIGHRRIGGARMYVMPELRPIRFRAGALRPGVPDTDLLVSPRHRMLVSGPVAEALFNTSEVLVAARDLVNDHSVLVDRDLREVTYVHLLLDKHQIVFANGLETESFHPGDMPLETIEQSQRSALLDLVPGLERDADAYGLCARRQLTAAEAAIMLYRQPYAH